MVIKKFFLTVFIILGWVEAEPFFQVFGAPKAKHKGLKILQYQAFACGYLPRVKLSLWVSYCYIKNSNAKLSRYQGRFVPDTFRLKKKETGFTECYDSIPEFIRFVIDKGHLAPDAAIKAFGQNAQKETYFLTNIIPQFANTNRFIWAGLEKEIRRWGERDTVWVVVGPLFYPKRDTFWLGTHNIAIPHACYCAVVRKRPLRMIGFIVPNDSTRRYLRDLPGFIVSVDSIEKLTGIDLFSSLPDNIEPVLEAEEAPGLLY